MKYTFEISYHHNNPTPSMRFSVTASNDQEALAKAYVQGMEHQYGESFGITSKEVQEALAQGDYHILKGHEDGDDELCLMHVWNQTDEHNGKKIWNRGFGLGGEDKDSTSKHENCWIDMVVKGRPKTRKELAEAIEGLVYDVRKLTLNDLRDIYQKLLIASERGRS